MPVRSIFLAAPNATGFKPLIDGVVMPVLLEANLRVVRMPTLDSPRIAGEILANVQKSDSMMAVAIGRNPNVFWELGLAFALGKPLILLADCPLELGLLTHAAQCVLTGKNETETRLRLSATVRELIAT